MQKPTSGKIMVRRYRRKRRRVHGRSFNRLVPNILTMLGLCAGLSAIKFSMTGHFTHAAAALLIAACMDGLDGRIARLLKGTSRFGAEFDSLSDFVCFGVVPPFILMLWALPATERLSFIPFILFTVCMALRLARFNSALDDDTAPEYAANFFSGVPAPAGAGLALFPVFLGLEAHRNHLEGVARFAHSPWLAATCLIVTAFLLVSTLPIWSFKNFKVPSRYILPMLVGTGAYAAILIAEPWGALAAAGIIYLIMIPLSRRSYWRLRREAEDSWETVEDDPPSANSTKA
ncbi:CDP-diacylglycerol--serine O-phosphatidyltransferase [Parasaccharibacter apium]|uniref:CDP-alcohol phosphatidyltransferase family protein n=1 Tax=unclassified Bombella TaxID=2644098 RepID=UPI000BFEB021|nr:MULTISPECIES: phosphatidylcholine/phosphatidylserine synthase [unclassified Bombella]MCT6855680.1 phosphatidylcholine/phosphatidylserine synthase [Bombella apis]MUG04984.1 phosphatidylcholine/phosphatidylserine synthase [Bombella sp. ESL0378]MUG90533.1 phosphatidylcholine/phosphatidylserine synthase [Bombella sp. ESL0385]PHI96200.1 CDP-diacylglycerol--serine O-phosphatidyltransferase [Parasaccharibacter apium]